MRGAQSERGPRVEANASARLERAADDSSSAIDDFSSATNDFSAAPDARSIATETSSAGTIGFSGVSAGHWSPSERCSGAQSGFSAVPLDCSALQIASSTGSIRWKSAQTANRARKTPPRARKPVLDCANQLPDRVSRLRIVHNSSPPSSLHPPAVRTPPLDQNTATAIF